MAGIAHLTDIYRKKGKEFINKLFDNFVTVNEKIDGSAFAVEKNAITGELEFYKRDGRNPISIVDRTLARFYERPIAHFQGLSARVLKSMPAGWRFGFEYLPSNDHNEVVYDRLPHNQLILSYVHVRDADGSTVRTIQDKQELDKWAKDLDVEQPPIVFQGELSDEQKDKIMEFLDTPFDQLTAKYKTDSFVRYIVTVLNPKMKRSFLNDDLDKPIEGVVFRFGEDGAGFTLAKLIDPIFQALAKQKSVPTDKSSDVYHITVLELMNYIDSINLSKFKPRGKTWDDRYLDFMCRVFNQLVEDEGDRYEDMDYDEPDYLKKSDFDLNMQYIQNPDTRANVERSEGLKKLFKILLATFRKKRRKAAGILTDQVVQQLNLTIDRVSQHVSANMRITESELPLFGEFIQQRGRQLVDQEDEEEEEGPEEQETQNDEFDLQQFVDRIAQSGTEPEPEDSKKKKQGQKSQLVNLVVGRFQPFHNGHVKMLEQMHSANKRKTVIVCVHPGHNNSGESPLSLGTLRSAMDNLKVEFPDLVADVRYVGRGFLGDVLSAVRPEYEPCIWAAGPDRVDGYKKQAEHNFKRNNELGLSDKFSIMETGRTMSGKDVRDDIRLDNYGQFKSKVPKCVQSAYTLMRKDIMKYEAQ